MGAFEITSFWGASLVSGRNTGNFLKNWALVDLSSRERKERQALTTKIPYAKDQGILTADQGKDKRPLRQGAHHAGDQRHRAGSPRR